MLTTFQIVKRTGSHIEPLPNAPTFKERAEAEKWAADYLAANPQELKTGTQAIEIRPIHKQIT